MVRRARLRVGQRVDEREHPARLEPATDERQEVARAASRGTWLSQNPVKTASTGAVRLGPGVADVEVGAQAVRDEPFAGPVERRRRGVVQRQLALRREERRPPAGPGGELDDLAADRQRVEPAAGDVELGVPGRVVDGTALVAAAAEVPVVVLGRARLVVGEHLGVAADRRRVGPAPATVAIATARRRDRRLAAGAGSPRPPLGQRLRGAGTAGTRCRRPCRRSPGRAAPSPRGRRRRGRRGAPPHHRQSNVARNGIRSRPTVRPASTSRSARCRRTPSGSKISASSSIPSMTRGPGRLK